MDKLQKILFVCTGNTCRSSMAEVIARKKIQEMQDKHVRIEVISAGTDAIPGYPAASAAVNVMKKRNIDLASHKSKSLTPEMIKEADVILTMTLNHKQRILSMEPSAVNKAFMLKEFALDHEEKFQLEKKYQQAVKSLKQKQENFFQVHAEEIKELHEKGSSGQMRLSQLDKELLQETWEERKAIEEVQDQVAALDVLDPYGGTEEIYHQCAQELEEYINKVLEKNII